MIGLLAAFLLAGAPAAASTEVCVAMVTHGDTQKPEALPTAFRLVGGPEDLPANPFADKLAAVSCERGDIIPDVRDIRLLSQYGVALFIRQADRMIVVEVSGGQVRVRLLEGKLTPEELTRLGARLDEMQVYRRPAA